jgi:putative sterol carrier protein
MTLAEITAGLAARAAQNTDFGHSVKFDFGDDGLILLDGTKTPPTVSNADGEAECTITMSLENFVALSSGDLDPATAFMMGKLKVEGSMGVALKLQSLLG